MHRITQNVTLCNSFDKVVNMYVILWQSGTIYAVAKEMDWHDVRL
jgi:hypothetical protein